MMSFAGAAPDHESTDRQVPELIPIYFVCRGDDDRTMFGVSIAGAVNTCYLSNMSSSNRSVTASENDLMAE